MKSQWAKTLRQQQVSALGGKDMMTRGQKVNKESEQQERANKHNLHLGLLVK